MWCGARLEALSPLQVRNAAAALLVAAGVVASSFQAAPADVLPAAVSSYATSDLAARGSFPDAATPGAFLFDAERAPHAAPASQSYLPLLYSALVPGLGEVTMGYRVRGFALMALEVAAWTGYFVKHGDGIDKRESYEAFADAHWKMDKWIADHPGNIEQIGPRNLENLEKYGRSSSGSGLWPGYIPWVSPEEDKQHYYENIGKYDWYISGWEDWDPLSNPYDRDTPLRDQYRAMRGESNDALDAANRFVWLSVGTRVFSLVQTAIIVRNRRGAEDDAGAGSGMALRARPRGWDGGELALEVRFK